MILCFDLHWRLGACSPINPSRPPTSVTNMTSIPTKKDEGWDKGASAPEAQVCARCLAPVSSHGIILNKACTRRKAAHYCGRACQIARWRGAQAVLRDPRGADSAAGITDLHTATGRMKTCGWWSVVPGAWTRSPRVPPCASCPAHTRSAFSRCAPSPAWSCRQGPRRCLRRRGDCTWT